MIHTLHIFILELWVFLVLSVDCDIINSVGLALVQRIHISYENIMIWWYIKNIQKPNLTAWNVPHRHILFMFSVNLSILTGTYIDVYTSLILTIYIAIQNMQITNINKLPEGKQLSCHRHLLIHFQLKIVLNLTSFFRWILISLTDFRVSRQDPRF